MPIRRLALAGEADRGRDVLLAGGLDDQVREAVGGAAFHTAARRASS